VIRHVQPEAEEAPAHPGAPDRVSKQKGMNRFVWDFAYPDAAWFSRMVLWTGFLQGPAAVPGEYAVRLTVGDKTETQKFTLKLDPRTTATQADLEEQFALLIQIRDAVSAANNGVRTIRNVKAQVADRAKRAGNASLGAALVSKISAVEARLYSVQNRAGQDMLNYPIQLNDQLGSLYYGVAATDAKPTAQQVEVFKLLNGQLDEQLKTLKGALDGELAKLNAELAKAKLPAIVPSTVEMP
jgi:small-conductance mechanosensitive channel